MEPARPTSGLSDSHTRLSYTPAEMWATLHKLLGTSPWPGADFQSALIERFVGDIIAEDSETLSRASGQPVLFLANHQTMVESGLFMPLLSSLTQIPISVIAHVQHRTSWLGRMAQLGFGYPGVENPGSLFIYDKFDPDDFLAAMPRVRDTLASRGWSLLVHVDGTRSLQCRQPVRSCSMIFLHLALELDMPIVPVRFSGGLPVEPLSVRADFPVGYGRQNYWIGRPMPPEELRPLSPDRRRALVIERLNALGPPIDQETPHRPDTIFGAEVRSTEERWGVATHHAVIQSALARLSNPHPETKQLLEGLAAGHLEVPDTPAGQWLARCAEWLTAERIPIEVLAA